MRLQPKEYPRYSIQAVLDAADMETVADLLGIEVKTRGNRKLILCPSHQDHNYGSCMLDNKHFRCWSCHAHGDVIEFVKAARRCTFQEALEWLAQIYGVPPLNGTPAKPSKPKRQPVDEETLMVIGLGGSCGQSVYATVGYFDDPFPLNYQMSPGCRAKWQPAPDKDRDYVLIQRLLCGNPLQDLFERDVLAYRALIARKASEAKERYQIAVEFLLNPYEFYKRPQQDVSVKWARNRCNELVATLAEVGITPIDIAKALKERQRICENLCIEFCDAADANELPQPATRKKNAYGRLKASGISF